MSKKCVLSGYFGFKNFGDEAILDVLIKKLQSLDNEVTVITSNPEYTLSQFDNINCIQTFDILTIVKTIFSSDILISGGGSLLQDVTSSKSLYYYLFIIFLGIIFNKKVIIFAQGIGPIKNPISKFITLILLRQCKYVSVRDKVSYNLLKKEGINADLLCDPIFSIDIPQVGNKDKILAVQLRNSKGINADFINRLAHQVTKDFSDYKIEIYSFQDEIDYKICKEFEKNVQMLNPDIETIIYQGLTNNQTINQIAQAQYLIAMRFHAIIIGLLTKTKVMAINYDIKVEKIAKEFNLPIINFNEDIKAQIDVLKNLDVEPITAQAKHKKFDWVNFEATINN